LVKPAGNTPDEPVIMGLRELMGRISFVTGLRLRLVLAFSRKIRPTSMLRQPTEKRKNAETRANVST